MDPLSAQYASERFIRYSSQDRMHSSGRGSPTSSMSRRQIERRPHIAFMQRRTKHKARIQLNSIGDQEYQQVVPDDIELAALEPFAPVPDPPFLLTQRLKKRKIYTNRCFEMSRVQREKKTPHIRSSNVQVPRQSLLWKKIDKVDEYIE